MSFRTVLVLRPGDLSKGGGLWVFIGLLFVAWMIMRSDESYKTSEQATREISLKFQRSQSERLAPKPQSRVPQLPSALPFGDWPQSVVFPVIPIHYPMTGGQARPRIITPIPKVSSESET